MKKLFLPLLFCLTLVSCSDRTVENKVFFYAFDTYVDIKTYQGTAEDIKELRGILETFSKETNNYQTSDVNGVSTINESNSEVQVGANLYGCLKQADTLTHDLETYFSIYLGSLSKIWKEALSTSILPTSETIDTELTKVRNTSLSFDDTNQKITRTGSGEIDLGAIAKGYALDIAKNHFKNKNISNYIVDAGSSSILLGEKTTDDGLFTIKIKNLSETYIKAKNVCISTSSVSEQYKVIDGVRYSHIVSPETGDARPINEAVIVLSEQGALGDALSTSMMLMSTAEVISIENEFHVKTIVIRDRKVEYINKDIELFH